MCIHLYVNVVVKWNIVAEFAECVCACVRRLMVVPGFTRNVPQVFGGNVTSSWPPFPDIRTYEYGTPNHKEDKLQRIFVVMTNM